jgi:hypothetical protein
LSNIRKLQNPYTDFVKAKMPELKDAPKGEKFKLIGEMWKAHKAANPVEPKAPKVADNASDNED